MTHCAWWRWKQRKCCVCWLASRPTVPAWFQVVVLMCCCNSCMRKVRGVGRCPPRFAAGCTHGCSHPAVLWSGIHSDVAHQVASSALGFLAADSKRGNGTGNGGEAEGNQGVWSSTAQSLAHASLRNYSTVTALAQQARTRAGRLLVLRRRTPYLCEVRCNSRAYSHGCACVATCA